MRQAGVGRTWALGRVPGPVLYLVLAQGMGMVAGGLSAELSACRASQSLLDPPKLS